MRSGGFGLVEIMLVVAVVVLMAGGGLYFGNFQQRGTLVQTGLDAEKQAQQIVEQVNDRSAQEQRTLNQLNAAPSVNSTQTTCHENEDYFVIGKMRAEGGTDFLIKNKTQSTQPFECIYSVGEGDFEISDERPMYYLALEGKFLVIDSGTAPYPRGLMVYDLARRTTVYTDGYSAPIDIGRSTIEYWETSSEIPTQKNCPELKEWESGGLGAAIESRVRVDLATLSKRELGENRCAARQ